jgi:LmbE family N-acetylglucosaminyl deacetylase
MSSSTTGASPTSLDILFILAHPDDESFGYGGLMAWAHQRGLRVGLVCATRGEAGEISDPSLGTAEVLGAVRERELRTAMDIAGVEPVRLLSYRDSGMIGTIENDDPRSLIRAPRVALLADVVYQIRELKPATVITFGPDGVYGHPDHVRIGEIATEAVDVAGTDDLPFLGRSWQVSRLYHFAVATEDLIEARRQASGLFGRVTEEQLAQWGIPRAEITHVFDVSEYVETKIRIMVSHATQLPYKPEPGSVGDPAMRPRLGRESLKRIPVAGTPADPSDDPLDAINTLQPTANS